MLKKIGFIVLGILFSLSLQAQMGIGTDMPDPAAELEIKSANRGLLIPRIALTSPTDQTTITAGNIESLLVYNTTSNTSLNPGFYYWFNNSWKRLSDENNLPDNVVIWDESNQNFTYIDSNGNLQNIDLNFDQTLTKLELSADGKSLIYTDENESESTIDLEVVIQQYQTLTSLVDNDNGTISYFDEAGNETLINLADANETLTYLIWNQNGNQLIYADENGNETTIDLPELVQQYETLTSLVDNDNGTISYFDEAGNETLINLADASETLTYLVWNQDGNQLIYTDENGNETAIDLPELVQQYETLTSLVDNDNGTISYFDEAGNETLIEVANIGETLTYFFWNEGTDEVIYTDENGEQHSIDLNLMFDYYQAVTTLNLNADGNLVYTDENGDENVISIDNLGETVTTLIDNANGTFTYTNEEGLETTINMEASQQVYITSVDYQPDMTDRIILGDALAGDITITLPNPAGFEGRKFTIKKEDDNEDFYLNVSGTISGIPTGEQLYTALPHTGWDLVSDGTTWRIVNKF